jgi:hypothetical protein
MADWEPEVIKPFPEYNDRPTGPVLVSVVKRHGQVQGYLWADDAADAADFLPARDAGEDAINLGTSWMLRLRECKKRGLTPTQALSELIAEGDTGLGEPGPLGDPVSFQQLQAAAGPPLWEQPSVQSRRGR